MWPTYLIFLDGDMMWCLDDMMFDQTTAAAGDHCGNRAAGQGDGS